MLKPICLLLLLIGWLGTPLAQNWKTYPYQEPETILTFPRDEGHHPDEPIEWWYTNARLIGEESGTEYSFMLTYFYYPALGFDGFRIFNISNETDGQFYDETLPCWYPTLSQDHLEIGANTFPTSREEWITKKDADGNLIPFEYQIKAGGQHGKIDLSYKALKRPLLVGGTGFFSQGIDDYTYYYSQTSIEVSGILTIKGFTEAVSGTAWIDRQYGTFNPNEGEPYEWFSLQLSNGMDINLWNVFTDDRLIPDTSTYHFLSAYIDEDSSLTTSDFKLERLAYAWMPDEEVCYAQQWRLTSEVLGANLLITTHYSDHEVELPFRFFEGITTVEGVIDSMYVNGYGFAELLHQYDHPQVQILNPNLGEPWEPPYLINWILENPDDGRQIWYDLSVSSDNRQSFTSIAEGLTDTSYLWDPTGFPIDSLYWIRLMAYSIDHTLLDTVETEMAFPISTSLDENLQISKINIFPNPAHDQIQIDLTGLNLKNGLISLFNTSGQLLMQRKTNAYPTMEIEVCSFPPGIYLLKVQDDRNQFSRKFIVDQK